MNGDPSAWAVLFRTALSIIDQVNADEVIVAHWTFGGGTALMLQIDHRESHDIDLFIDDPQLLGFLAPYEDRFTLDHAPVSYTRDGTSVLKIAFEHGEIDFICAPALTEAPTTEVALLGRTVAMDTPAEIVAKKLRFRGGLIQPRDVFDIAAVLRSADRAALAGQLRPFGEYCRKVRTALARMDRDLLQGLMRRLPTRPAFADLTGTALDAVLDFLDEVAPAAPPG